MFRKRVDFQPIVNIDDNIFVTGDSYRLNQILNNFISNAVKFTKKGEVVFSVDIAEVKGTPPSSRSPQIEGDALPLFGLVESGGGGGKVGGGQMLEVKFSLRDTGIGMDKETLSKIFKPFTQVPRLPPSPSLLLRFSLSYLPLGGLFHVETVWWDRIRPCHRTATRANDERLCQCYI